MPESEVDTCIEGSLAAEATMIVIDTLELIVQVCECVHLCSTEHLIGVNVDILCSDTYDASVTRLIKCYF